MFDAIKSGSKAQANGGLYSGGYATEYVLRYDNNELRLNRGVIIDEPEDLPKELLLQFFLNSPYYRPLENTDNTPLIESHE